MDRNDAAPHSDAQENPDAEDFPVDDPFRWCVRGLLAKVLLVVIMGNLAQAAGGLVGSWTGVEWTDFLVGWALGCTGAYLLTRIFRAADESSLPRPWWKLTGHSTASFMIGVLLLVTVLLGDGWYFARPLSEQLVLLLPVALAGLYFHSSYRMGGFRFGAPSGQR